MNSRFPLQSTKFGKEKLVPSNSLILKNYVGSKPEVILSLFVRRHKFYSPYLVDSKKAQIVF